MKCPSLLVVNGPLSPGCEWTPPSWWWMGFSLLVVNGSLPPVGGHLSLHIRKAMALISWHFPYHNICYPLLWAQYLVSAFSSMHPVREGMILLLFTSTFPRSDQRMAPNTCAEWLNRGRVPSWSWNEETNYSTIQEFPHPVSWGKRGELLLDSGFGGPQGKHIPCSVS